MFISGQICSLGILDTRGLVSFKNYLFSFVDLEKITKLKQVVVEEDPPGLTKGGEDINTTQEIWIINNLVIITKVNKDC